MTLAFAIENYWKKHLEEEKAQAIWRLPQTNEFHLIQENGKGKSIQIQEIDQLPEGFITSSFDGEVYYIHADVHITGILPVRNQPKFNNQIEVSNDTKNHFTQWVQKSVEAIRARKFQKVVLSRTDTCEISDFDVYDSFLKLATAYPNAMVAAFYLPEQAAVWMCATPELLVQQNAEGIFKTVSLAGTQTALDTHSQPLLPQHASWTQKEIEEQAFVSRYIIECFKRIRLREYIENGPKTIIAGNLMHLKSEFLVDTKALNVPQLASTMLEMLHPTSAVCGTPKEEAKQWISEAELHDREMYAGFLGPIGFQGEINVFVNLRTMRLRGETITFFAGCGITEDSVPEKEWEETTMKCRTLKGILMSS